MKKAFALLLILALALALCACGSKSVVGAWEAVQDMTEGMTASGSPIAAYMKNVKVIVRLELREDGSCTMLLDGSSMITEVRNAVREYLEASCAANGSSLEEKAAASGLTVDQVIDMVMEGQETDDLTRSIDGTYTVAENTLTFNFEGGSSRTGTWEKDNLFLTTDQLGDICFTRCK